MQNIIAKNIMKPWTIKFSPDTPISTVLSQMAKVNIQYAPILIKENEYIGFFILTAETISYSKSSLPVKNFIDSDIPVLAPKSDIQTIQSERQLYSVFPIVENKKLQGIITRECLVNHLLTEYSNRMEAHQLTIQQLKSKINLLAMDYQELKGVMDHSYDGVAITNSEGITIKVNKAWDRLTGLNRDDVIGVPLDQLVEKGYFSDSVTMRVIKSKKTTSIIQKMKSGKQAMMTGSPILDSTGHLYQVIINIRDVTELFELKEDLMQKEVLAERYHTEISQLRLKQAIEENIVAESKAMQDLLDLAARIARVESTVLLTGESGVGKGVVARFIHKLSDRGAKKPFIVVNCGAIPSNLLESELFGYVGGAFTGANQKGKIGLFELANGGTLFLDEIGELPLELQVKLLHVLQEKEMTRVGGTETIKLDVRIIAATNKDLLQLIKDGKFREDLFYRINVVPLSIPPLRSRKEDILPLSTHYLNLYNEKYSLNKSISGELMDMMLDHDWLGNIREFSNLIERMVVTSTSDSLTLEDFPFTRKNSSGFLFESSSESNSKLPTLQQATNQLELKLINQALEIGKTQAKAAELLGLSLSTFLRKMNKVRNE